MIDKQGNAICVYGGGGVTVATNSLEKLFKTTVLDFLYFIFKYIFSMI